MLNFSPAAIQQIERIRADYIDAFPDDPPELLFIGFGMFVPNGAGQGVETIGVGFFQRSEINDTRLSGARESAGLRYLLVNPESQRQRFETATLNYSEERAFFLL